MAFAPGNVVTLKSGGQSMTVVAVSDEDVDCLWVTDSGELFRQSIPAIALTIIDATDLEEAEELTEDEEDEQDEQDGEEEDEEDADRERGDKRRAKRR